MMFRAKNALIQRLDAAGPDIIKSNGEKCPLAAHPDTLTRGAVQGLLHVHLALNVPKPDIIADRMVIQQLAQ